MAASGRSCAQPRSLSCAPLAAPARRRLHCCPQGPSRHVGNDQHGHDQESGTSATTHNSPTGRRHPHTHVRRRVFGQVPSSCCSPPPPVKAGRAPKPCIDAAGAARPACTTTACGGPNHDTRTPHAGGARDSRSTMRPARCQATPCPTNAARQPPSRVVGSATSVAPPHTHQRRGTTIHAQRAQRAQPE